MITWIENADLSSRNTLGFQVSAERFIEVETVDQLELALTDVEHNQWPLLLLGGGSNLVLKPYIPGAVISVNLQGINILVDDESSAIVEVGAGVNWHQSVGRLLEMGLHGLENLALIPGNVGAAPVQNIGAYGVELADCFHSLTAYDRKTGDLVQLNKDDCCFGYRDSLFKSREPGRYIIWQVRFLLSTVFSPNLGYRALSDYLDQQGVTSPGAYDVYRAVCEIRQSKLPTPDKIGNVGSFFENPIVQEEQYLQLKQKFPNLVAYPDKPGSYKLAAGWLIDQAGWKGHKATHVGVYDKQALVLVNLGEGDSEALLGLAKSIQDSVLEKFSVQLRMEPRVYPA